MKYFWLKVLFCHLIILSQGCSNRDNTAQSTVNPEEKTGIKIVDSVVVKDIIAKLFLFQTANKDFLVFRDKGNSKIYVVDHSGKILHEWDNEGDVPGAFSEIADNFNFSPSGGIVIHDNFSGIRVFNISGELFMQNRAFQPQYGISAAINIFRKNQVITRNNLTYLIHHLDLMDEIQEVGREFFVHRKNLLLTDLTTGKTSQHLPFPAESKFMSGKAFPFADFRPVFYYDENDQILYLAFQNEPVLYTYDWSGDEPKLMGSTPLELPNFHSHEGWEYGEVFYGMLNPQQLDSPFPGRIQSLEKIGDYLLLNYRPSPEPGEIDSWLKANRGEGTQESLQAIREKRRPKTVLIREGKVLATPINFPRMYYDSYRIIGEEIWWMKPTSKEVEDEDFVIYRGELELE